MSSVLPPNKVQPDCPSADAAVHQEVYFAAPPLVVADVAAAAAHPLVVAAVASAAPLVAVQTACK